MKKFITKQDYLDHNHNGVCFFTVSNSDRAVIKNNLEQQHRQIVENSRKAADEAAKVILNR